MFQIFENKFRLKCEIRVLTDDDENEKIYHGGSETENIQLVLLNYHYTLLYK